MFGVGWYFIFVFPKDQKASYDFNDMDADPKPRDSDPDNWFVIHLFMDFFFASFRALNFRDWDWAISEGNALKPSPIYMYVLTWDSIISLDHLAMNFLGTLSKFWWLLSRHFDVGEINNSAVGWKPDETFYLMHDISYVNLYLFSKMFIGV